MVYLSTFLYTIFEMPQLPKQKLQPLNIGSKSVGERIASIRKQKGLTQTELAEQIGITQKMVTDYETGRLHINEDILARIAISLQVSADTILGLNETDIHKEKLFPLRYTRRMKELDKLPESKKKSILQTLDDLIRANS